ncbi:hypothetical protein CAEBREN_31315 [Caenorhabditis brenneri]|uniref:Uncharacterized protein n=1 Tax=Caenorhabditis brenneri TaxID=135651 RepID=G0PJ39_CAEBE|nr:hypothetical protein CAEBREN_31315 [Caenorhabditis brenneri]
MFHVNFIILAAPIFGGWCELITGKLITMAYQVKLFSSGIVIDQFYALWTDNPEKMLVVESFEGLELLIIAGFLEYHYMFSVVFGVVAVAIERLTASILIDNYESTNKIFIPIILTVIVQILAIITAFLALIYKLDIISINATWIVSCMFSSIMFLVVERINGTMGRPKWKIQKGKKYSLFPKISVKKIYEH